MSNYYNYTYCIRWGDLKRVEQALISIFERECCDRIPLPPLSIEEIKKRYRSSWQLERELWMFGLFFGASEWTIIKTFPQELLCYRTKDATRPRLSELAMQTGSDAFCLSVYNSHQMLMEVNAQGNIFISGEDDIDRWEEGKFFDEQINLKQIDRFFLLKMPNEKIQSIVRTLSEELDKRYDEWELQFLEGYAEDYFPLMTLDELEQWKARWKGMFFSSGKQLQFDGDEEWQQLYHEWLNEAGQSWLADEASPLFEQALERLLGGSRSYWYLGREPLIYRAYTQQQQLEAEGARLLYFRPAEQLQQTMDEITRSKRTNSVQTDEDDIPW